MRTACRCGSSYRACAVPQIDGAPWQFSSPQFRRTLAWHIANRPFGTVAGKIQYKHASIAMFEGYSGGSPSGFRREVEQERALGQLDDVVEHYEQAVRCGLAAAGSAAARVQAEFVRIRDELGDLPGSIVDPQRLRAMLAHRGRTLYVGLLADCFFDPETALCLDHGKDDLDYTALSQCRPDRCPNACITRRQLSPWQASIAEAERLLADRRLPPLQRTALEQDVERMRRLVAPQFECLAPPSPGHHLRWRGHRVALGDRRQVLEPVQPVGLEAALPVVEAGAVDAAPPARLGDVARSAALRLNLRQLQHCHPPVRQLLRGVLRGQPPSRLRHARSSLPAAWTSPDCKTRRLRRQINVGCSFPSSLDRA